MLTEEESKTERRNRRAYQVADYLGLIFSSEISTGINASLGEMIWPSRKKGSRKTQGGMDIFTIIYEV